ncbi:MAG: PQQ-binding-like beta-propeller repeat protein [Candidatus Omnitrophica bacterium]|nr:PQQ-binding-like beta-propeller repeat protein [Candidatus Omnitrophota bacterium]
MMNGFKPYLYRLSALMIIIGAAAQSHSEDWLQLKYDSRHSGNAYDRSVNVPLGLVGFIPMTDAIFTSPVIAGDRVYAIDGSGVVFCIDARSLSILWKFESAGGKRNCNNVSSPALAGQYLHFGTMAGNYYVLNANDGSVVKEIHCGDPIFSSPVVADNRVYFVTLGSTVYAIESDGSHCWTWDFVREVLKFSGDRWSGKDWLQFKQDRVTWRDHFCTSRNMAVFQKTLVIPAGGRTVFLEDAGKNPNLLAIGQIPAYAGREYPAAFGQSIGENGDVYIQYHRRDNAGRVEILKWRNGNVETDYVPGTQTAINLPGLLSFSSVSLRGRDVYRCRPEQNFEFIKYSPDQDAPLSRGGYPSIASPILLQRSGVYGGLDGSLYVIPLSGNGPVWSFKTPFGCAISAPAAVCDGRIYFGCEDGCLYILGPNGDSPLPSQDLGLSEIRSPLSSQLTDPAYDWYTNYANQSNTNANDQDVKPPLTINWIRRVEGTVKHLPVSGGGRLYTHTAEGQIMAVEQETGRLLWRKYWPNVYLSFTAPIYRQEKILVPQAGMKKSMMRCLDAKTGRLIWEAPFTGSPSWSRQAPPVIYGNLAIYASGSGRYAAQGTEKAFIFSGTPELSLQEDEIMSWMYTHNNPYYPKDNKPLIWAWDMETGKEVWTKDFSDIGLGGNDCGLCLMDGTLYYSTFFGYSSSQKKRRGLPPDPNGLTAALDPKTGAILWSTTDYYLTAGCTLSGKNGRLYLGGYNQPDEETNERYIFCLDAKDGSLVWKSDPVESAVNVVSVGEEYIFSNAIRGDGHIFDKETGKIVSRFNNDYNCTRFALSEPFLLGANMDMVDLSNNNQLSSTGPAIDSRECLGSTVSNGRIFYTSQASGIQVSAVCGEEAQSWKSPWER